MPEWELFDDDGYRCRGGNLGWLDANARHNSYSPEGALLVEFLGKAN